MNRPAIVLAFLALASLIAYLAFSASGGAAPLAPVEGPVSATDIESADAREAARSAAPEVTATEPMPSRRHSRSSTPAGGP